MDKTVKYLLFFLTAAALCAVAHAQYYPWGDMHWQAPVASSESLPAAGNALGDVRLETTDFGIYGWNGSSWEQLNAAGSGTVTSVGLEDESTTPIYSTGAAVTTSGDLTFTLENEPVNTVFAGPASTPSPGPSAQPTFRALVNADIPSALSLSYLTLTGTPSSGNTGPLQISYTANASATSNVWGLQTVPTIPASQSITNMYGAYSASPTLGGGASLSYFSDFSCQGASAHHASNNACLADNVTFSGNWFLNQSGSDPNFLKSLELSTPLAVGYGGLGISTTPSNGYVPIGNGTDYTAAALTAGSGITVTNASGSVTIAEQYPLPSPSPSGQYLEANGTAYVLGTPNPYPLPSPSPSGEYLESNGTSYVLGVPNPYPLPSPSPSGEFLKTNGTAYVLTNSLVTSFTGDGTVFSNSASTGAVTGTLETHTANTVLAGPSSGSAAAPTFRALVSADMASLTAPNVQVLTFNSTTFTGEVTSGSSTVTNVSSFTGLYVGMGVSASADVTAGSYIISMNPVANTLVLSANATGGSSTTVTFTPYNSGSGYLTGTYVVPSSPAPLYLKVIVVGGGGGGGGSGTTNTGGEGGTGGNTFFDSSSILQGAAGSPGLSIFNGSGGAGGGTTISTSTSGFSGYGISGGWGSATTDVSVAYGAGGVGGISAFGGGNGGGAAAPGVAGAANSGAGGGGGAGNSTAAYAGCGGGAGGYGVGYFTSLSSTYSFQVGGGGAAGAAGTSGEAGGAGGSGMIIVEAHYQ